ncbi:SDR family NAD(P)-dependent oxidoreductase [Actinomadura rugatobispora]|uniref:SDR family NAD(P)-dependent oxidoreductase n=1 Tax=Actinomadura rugatobispora TaxID=1994 RepID=A0ABW0ZSH8_9ACTN|nr:SDR family NAD(P)-dependent oxidoreductase [Actinomadura rugatobispora]
MSSPATDVTDLTGKAAIITGSGTGIGREIALLLARRGADVVLAARNEERLIATAEQIAATTGRKAQVVPTDVRDDDQMRALVDAAVASHGRLDVLVNNAGGSYLKPMVDLDIAEWDRIISLNLTSVFSATKAAIPHLEADGGGSIVNISSSSASTGTLGGAAYSAAKSGVEMLTKVAAAELGPRGIRVNCVAPGLTRSEGAERSWSRGNLDVSGSEERMPLRRVAEPLEIAKLVLFLVSDHASYLTGEVLHADGGPKMDGIPEI